MIFTCLVQKCVEAKLLLQNKILGSFKNFFTKPRVLIRDLKTIRPTNLIEKATIILKKVNSVKYGFASEKIESKSIESDQLKKDTL